MPLIKSASKEAVSHNIKAEKAAGKPHKQAIAIALSVARRARKRADGGRLLSDRLMNETLIRRPPQDTEGVEQRIGTPHDWSRVQRRVTEDDSLSPSNMALGLLGGPSQAMFLGPAARTADKAALALAQRMANSGSKMDQIWSETGWHRGADAKWRFEIPDNQSRLTDVAANHLARGPGAEVRGQAHQIFEHPQLYEAYPQLRGVEMSASTGSQRGAYSPAFDTLPPAISVQGRDKGEVRSVALHELQHGVQQLENFGMGGNNKIIQPGSPAWEIYKDRLRSIKELAKISREEFSIRANYEGLAPLKDYKDFVNSANKISPAVDRAAQESAASEAYRRMAGEVEARNVQTRRDMAHRNVFPPWSTQDVPDESQFVRFFLRESGKMSRGGALTTARRMARKATGGGVGIDLSSPAEQKRQIQRSLMNMKRNKNDGSTVPAPTSNPKDTLPPGYAGGGPTQQIPWTQRAAAQRLSFAGGMLNSPIPGRTDKLSLNVPAGSYVVPSSVVSFLGQDNSMAGAGVLDAMFGMGPGGIKMGSRRKFRSPQARFGKRSAKYAEGGEVDDGTGTPTPISAAGGEYVIPPEALMEKYGDLDYAHKVMDQFVKETRKKHIKTLKKLPGPERD